MENNKQTEKDLFRLAEKKLYDYKYIDSKVEILEFKISELELEDPSITAVDYSKDKLCPTNAFSSSVENDIIRRDTKIAQLQAEKKRLVYEKELINKLLKILTPEELEIIQLRYINPIKRSVISITMELCISHDTYHRIKNNAINKIKEYLL